MLIYNPCFDIYHCIFRLLCILSILPTREHSIELIRIIDFYVLFPHLFSEISLPKKHANLKNKLIQLKTNYNEIPNPQRLFQDIANLQLQSLYYLSSIDIIDNSKIKNNIILRTNKIIPDKLLNIISDSISHHENIKEIVSALSDIPLNGPKGLKARSGLLEFRYDVI